MSERPARAVDFTAEDFGAPPVPGRTLGSKPGLGGSPGARPGPAPAVFEEFASSVPKPEPFKREETPGPSLGYLFAPFDPGAPEENRGFEEVERPAEEPYGFEDLDTRDRNVINTLDRANKKAKEIIYDAYAQSRRLEAQLLDSARLEAEELSKEVKLEAERVAAETLAEAKAKAEAIASESAAADAAREQAVIKLQADQKTSEERQAALDARAASLDERAAALDARQAKLDADEAELAVRRGDLETTFKAESAAALAKSLAKGQADGLQKGLLEGRAKARGEVLSRSEGFFKIMGRVSNLWRELWRSHAPMMTTLAVEAAEAIVNKEIESGRGLAAGALRACVERLQKCHEVVLKVRPEDLAEIEDARAELRDHLDGLVNITFKADESLGPGDLIMETDAGRLDATMRARRERVMGILREALDQGLVEEAAPEDEASLDGPPEGSPAPDSGAPDSGSAPETAPKAQEAAPDTAQETVQEAPEAPQSAQEVPKAPEAPDTAPKAQEAAPKAPETPIAQETAPKAPQIAPETPKAQETAPETPKAQETSPEAPEAPEAAPDASETAPEAPDGSGPDGGQA